MPFRIIFHPLAEKEFAAAYQWYEERLKGLGDRFSRAVEERLVKIRTSPSFYPKKRGVFREAKAITFPYVIVYKVDHKSKTVFVSAIHHTSTHPRKKYRSK